jgi:fructose-1,6-bisphosphatase/inositol monophosphatase family enzyme
MDYQKELEFAKNMAAEAGKIMKKYYRIDQGIEIKSDSTPVTIADKAVNDLLIERVKVEFSDCGVLGEEESWNEDREKLWVCDPIDGTVGFILHIPTSAFSLAYIVDGVVKAAVAYNPWVDELYHAVVGGGAYRGDQPIKVSTKKWGEYIHIANSSGGHDIFRNNDLVKRLASEKVFINSSPGIVYHGCLIAEGSLEGRTFVYHTAHDIAAVKLIIEEAGGKVTDIDGNEQRYDRKLNGALMSNGLIHDKLLEVAKEVK